MFFWGAASVHSMMHTCGDLFLLGFIAINMFFLLHAHFFFLPLGFVKLLQPFFFPFHTWEENVATMLQIKS
jgi:hypothetical protein